MLASLLSSPAGTVVRFLTSVGNLDVELYDADKPVTVSNFLAYMQGGSYTNIIMHRDVSNFVVQGGEYYVAYRGTTNASLETVVTMPPITNEYFTGKFYSNVLGTIAMARTSDPNSASSQFYFNLAKNSAALGDTNKSGQYVVFGHVIGGTNVLSLFNLGPKNTLIKDTDLSFVSSDLNTLPVFSFANPNNVTYDDLLYVSVVPAPAYTPVQGSYNGLFSAPSLDAVPAPAPGFFSMTLGTNGKFSGSLRVGANRYSFSGSLDTNGLAAAKASGPGLPLNVSVYVDPTSGGDQMTGTIAGPTWAASLTAYRAPFNAQSNPARTYQGAYTMVLPSSGQAGQPAGTGYAAITVDAGGNVKVSGSLADGTSFTEAVPVSQDGHWPLYAPLTGNGLLSGWMVFTNRPAQSNQPADNLNGLVLWMKPAKAKFFPAGYTNQLSATGETYQPPTGSSQLFSTTNLSLVLTGGDIPGPLTNRVTLTPANKFKSMTNALTMTLTLPSGLFSGSLRLSSPTRTVAFKGALLQSQNSGSGYFLETTQGGELLLLPQQ